MSDSPVREGLLSGDLGKTWYQIVGAGDAVPLVTVHGGPGATHDYLEPLAALSDERPVVFYDQLGAGKSDKPVDVSGWNNEVLIEELTRLLDLLDFERVHLLGQSWGTIVAAEYALRRPDRLASLILASPCLSLPIYAAAADALRAELPIDVQEILDRHEAAGTTDSPEYQAASLEFYNRHVCRIVTWPDCVARTFNQFNQDIYELMQGPSEFVINGIHKDYDLTPRLPDIQTPTFFTCGRYDEMRPADIAYYASLIDGAEVAIFEQSSHMPHVEEPEAYLDALRAFFARVEDAPAQ